MPDLPDPLPDVQPLASPITEDDVLRAIAGLRPGWYTVRDLYPRFLRSEQVAGNLQPGSKIGFSLVLAGMGLTSRNVRNHVKAWRLSIELLARADRLKDQA